MNTNTIDFSKMSQTEILAFAQKMQQENQRLMEEKTGKISFAVSMRGAISVYGLGRFPTTLHVSQWEALLATSTTLKAFIDKHREACAKQAKLCHDITDELKAAGVTDKAKQDAGLKDTLIKMNNPYVRIKDEA